jgi:hypothetical protein
MTSPQTPPSARDIALTAYGPVRLAPADERLLAAAYAAGMTVAYGYIGGMGHFNPTVVCIELTKILDERVMVTEEIKIVCDVNGEWKFV